MAKISLAQRPSNTDAVANPIYLRISHADKTRYVATGIKVPRSKWNQKAGEVRRSHADSLRLNRYLTKWVGEAQSIAHELVTSDLAPTARRIQVRLRERMQGEPKRSTGFLAYCRELLETWEGRWAYQTMLAYKTAVHKLEEWWESDRLDWQEVTPSLARQFAHWLATEKQNSANTRHKNITTLRMMWERASKDGEAPAGRNPWDAVDVRKEAGEKQKLTTEQLRALRNVELEEGSLIANVRDWFFFAFYAGGMRFSDVAELRREHVRDEGGEVRVFYRMGKTKNLHGVPLVAEATEIIEARGWRDKAPDAFVFSILEGYDMSTPKKRRAAISSRNALANRYLGQIGEKAGVDVSVSMHLARHSAAGYLLEQGYDVRTIQRVLGHANVRVTEAYLRGFDSGGPDDASRSLSL